MANLKAVVKLATVSGLPRDQIVNTFHFTGDPTGDLDAGIRHWVDVFYNSTMPTSGHNIAHYISDFVIHDDPSSVGRISVYLMPPTGTPLGSPIYEDHFGLIGASGDRAMPNEVALCLSYAANTDGVLEVGPGATDIPTSESAQDQGAPATHSGATRPKARTRGRIYIGPLNIDAITNESGDPTYPAPDNMFISTLKESAENFAARVAAGGYTWCVWSQRELAMRFVTQGWVDNAWDTQRRRGVAPTTRTSWVPTELP